MMPSDLRQKPEDDVQAKTHFDLSNKPDIDTH
jgi:hypothetical protein